jgi:hypothetical protein
LRPVTRSSSLHLLLIWNRKTKYSLSNIFQNIKIIKKSKNFKNFRKIRDFRRIKEFLRFTILSRNLKGRELEIVCRKSEERGRVMRLGIRV